jgi:hypothetical protein
MLFGLVLAVFGGYLADRFLKVDDPPAPAGVEPNIILTVAPPTSGKVLGLNTFDVRVGIKANGCHNPVQVLIWLDLRGKKAIAPARYVSAPGFLHVQVTDPTKSARNFVAGELSPAAWRSVLSISPSSRIIAFSSQAFSRARGARPNPASWPPQGPTFVTGLGTWFAESSTLKDKTVDNVPVLQMTFDADWESGRSYGTCYIRLPNLLSPPTGGTNGTLAPGHGSVQLSSRPSTSSCYQPSAAGACIPSGTEAVDTSSSIPPPTDPSIPLWSCDMRGTASTPGGSNCGGLAVINEPNANRKTQLWLIVAGALLGLGFAVFAEAFLKWNWPLPKDEAASDPDARS